MAGKLYELGRLEEVKVVTRSPLVNQRRDHYRVDRRVSALPTPRTLYLITLPLPRRAAPPPPRGGAPRRRPASTKRTEASALF